MGMIVARCIWQSLQQPSTSAQALCAMLCLQLKSSICRSSCVYTLACSLSQIVGDSSLQLAELTESTVQPCCSRPCSLCLSEHACLTPMAHPMPQAPLVSKLCMLHQTKSLPATHHTSCSHLCFQARMSDDTQQAPHPRL